MTLMEAIDKRYKDEKSALMEECKEGLDRLHVLQKQNYLAGKDFKELMDNRGHYRINHIELMSVDVKSNGQYYQQFMIVFENNVTEYFYVLIGEPDGKA